MDLHLEDPLEEDIRLMTQRLESKVEQYSLYKGDPGAIEKLCKVAQNLVYKLRDPRETLSYVFKAVQLPRDPEGMHPEAED